MLTFVADRTFRTIKRLAAAEKISLSPGNELPLLVRQALAHGSGSAFQGFEVVAHARRLGGVGQVGDQCAFENAARLRGRRNGAQHQHVALRHAGKPRQQRLRILVFATQALKNHLRQPAGVFSAFCIAAKPEKILGCAAGDWRFLAQ